MSRQRSLRYIGARASALTLPRPGSRLKLVTGKSIWRTLITSGLLAFLIAPCPAAIAAFSGPDPHQCCHKSDEEAPAAPDSSACAAMCAREQAERAVLIEQPADGSFIPVASALIPVQARAFLAAPVLFNSTPPGAADIRLLTCTFLT